MVVVAGAPAPSTNVRGMRRFVPCVASVADHMFKIIPNRGAPDGLLVGFFASTLHFNQPVASPTAVLVPRQLCGLGWECRSVCMQSVLTPRLTAAACTPGEVAENIVATI